MTARTNPANDIPADDIPADDTPVVAVAAVRVATPAHPAGWVTTEAFSAQLDWTTVAFKAGDLLDPAAGARFTDLGFPVTPVQD